MRKIAIIAAALGLLTAAPAFAATNSRNMSAAPSTVVTGGESAINFSINVSATGHENFYLFDGAGNNVSGNGNDSNIFTRQSSYSWGATGFATSLSPGTYTAIDYDADKASTDPWCGSGQALSTCQANVSPTTYGLTTITITAPAAPPAGLISIPSDFGSSLTANIGAQVGDQGTLLMIGVAAGVPLVFYVIEQLVGLVPRKRR